MLRPDQNIAFVETVRHGCLLSGKTAPCHYGRALPGGVDGIKAQTMGRPGGSCHGQASKGSGNATGWDCTLTFHSFPTTNWPPMCAGFPPPGMLAHPRRP